MSARVSLPPRVLPSKALAQIVDTINTLAIDAVQAANSGHPGMPMGGAVMGSVLWGQFLVHDPQAPAWPDRDRFVLSCGHGSMLLYALLHLSGLHFLFRRNYVVTFFRYNYFVCFITN